MSDFLRDVIKQVGNEYAAIVDDGVEELVRHLPPRQVRHALELVVDEELRSHRDAALSK